MQVEFTNQWGRTYHLTFNVTKYLNNNNLAVTATCYEDGFPEPYGNVTVNLGEKLPENQAYIDVNNMPGIEELLEELGIAKHAYKFAFSGFIKYPLYEFDLEKIKEYEEC